MTALQIILSIAGIVAYGCCSWMALDAWGRTKRQQRFLTNMGEAVAKTYALVAAMSLEAEVDKLNDMERQKRSLVEGEHYEQASQLQQLIERQQRKIARGMESMRQTFGDQVEVSMEHIKSSDE